jgi:hypothetical protein
MARFASATRRAVTTRLPRRPLPVIEAKREVISPCFIRAAVIAAALSGGSQFLGEVFAALVTLLGGH